MKLCSYNAVPVSFVVVAILARIIVLSILLKPCIRIPLSGCPPRRSGAGWVKASTIRDELGKMEVE